MAKSGNPGPIPTNNVHNRTKGGFTRSIMNAIPVDDIHEKS